MVNVASILGAVGWANAAVDTASPSQGWSGSRRLLNGSTGSPTRGPNA